jgi:4-hydroxybenzoate polyprenyltransferase
MAHTGPLIYFAAWGLTMAAYTVSLPLRQYWIELAKFLVMAINVRGSACTINDIFDRNFDAGVGMSLLLYS